MQSARKDMLPAALPTFFPSIEHTKHLARNSESESVREGVSGQGLRREYEEVVERVRQDQVQRPISLRARYPGFSTAVAYDAMRCGTSCVAAEAEAREERLEVLRRRVASELSSYALPTTSRY
eukprot:1928098-Rhodomonas_salina.2